MRSPSNTFKTPACLDQTGFLLKPQMESALICSSEMSITVNIEKQTTNRLLASFFFSSVPTHDFQRHEQQPEKRAATLIKIQLPEHRVKTVMF